MPAFSLSTPQGRFALGSWMHPVLGRPSAICALALAGPSCGAPPTQPAPRRCDAPAGPADVAAVAVLWAAWAREPESTRSRLMVPASSQELFDQAGAE